MDKFTDRLQWLIDGKKISQAGVARGIGAQPARITRLLSGDVKNPQRITILKLAEFFKCNFEWLKTGKGNPFFDSASSDGVIKAITQRTELDFKLGKVLAEDVSNEKEPNSLKSNNNVLRTQKVTTPSNIPVVGKVPAGVPETNEWEIEYNIQVPDMPEHCFAMKVIGDSMEPSISAGEHVIFILDYNLESGNVVIVTDEYGDSMVKRYKVKDGIQYLVSDNSKYSPVKPNGGFHIVGKVISSVLQKKH